MGQLFNNILSVLIITWAVGYFGYLAGTLIHLLVGRWWNSGLVKVNR
jgi:hypothetical protein